MIGLRRTSDYRSLALNTAVFDERVISVSVPFTTIGIPVKVEAANVTAADVMRPPTSAFINHRHLNGGNRNADWF